jgi:hypothetical protein
MMRFFTMQFSVSGSAVLSARLQMRAAGSAGGAGRPDAVPAQIPLFPRGLDAADMKTCARSQRRVGPGCPRCSRRRAVAASRPPRGCRVRFRAAAARRPRGLLLHMPPPGRTRWPRGWLWGAPPATPARGCEGRGCGGRRGAARAAARPHGLP